MLFRPISLRADNLIGIDELPYDVKLWIGSYEKLPKNLFSLVNKLRFLYLVIETPQYIELSNLNELETFTMNLFLKVRKRDFRSYLRFLMNSTSNNLKKFHFILVYDPNIINNNETMIEDSDVNISINNEIFNRKPFLEELTLRLNIDTIDDFTFANMTKLSTLVLRQNYLKHFDCDTIPKSLTVLDLSYNLLQEFTITDPLPNLMVLKLNNNRIKNFTLDLSNELYPKLSSLNLSNNAMKQLNIIEGDWKNTRLSEIFLQNNLFDDPKFYIWTVLNARRLDIHIDGTFPACECDSIRRINYIGQKLKRISSPISKVNIKSFLYCHLLPKYNILLLNSECQCVADIFGRTDKDSLFFTKLIKNCSAYDWVMDGYGFYNSHCELSDFYSFTYGMVFSKSNESDIGVFEVYRKDFSSISFTIENYEALQHLPNLIDLNLTNNRFFIHAQNAGIFEIKIENLPSSDLEELNLANNSIRQIDFKVLDHLYDMKTILSLSGNPFICDCAHIKMYRKIASLEPFITDFNQMICSDGKPFDPNSRQLCISPWFILLYALLALMTLLAIGLGVYLRNSLEIQVYIYSRGWFPAYFRPECDDGQCNFDVFLSFSEKDDEFALLILKLLEEDQDPPFKVCYHHRDWMVGERIDHQIISSVEESRKTVIIISQSFLSSHWANMEFTTAHYKMLEEKSPKILLILHGEIDTADLGPELKSYIKTTTYLKSDDKWFEKKLLYSLRRPQIEKKQLSPVKTENEINETQI
uniref:CSON007157 protein n=1 Tax=Culicoides sonorensis TaxID=179676 RepID=A0A336MW51_CULSO